MVYRGQVKGGVIVFDEPTRLPEGATVAIRVVEPPLDIEGEPPLDIEGEPPLDIEGEPPLDIEGEPIHPAFLIGDLAIDTGIPDLGVNIDHYLYGHPKVEDER